MFRHFPVNLPALVSPELAPYFEELAYKHDPKNWFLWREQTPPRGFKGLRQTGKFPGGASAVVRAYEFGNDLSRTGASVVDRPAKGCGADAVAEDGTLCSSAVAPGVTLSDAQAAELFAVVNETDPASRRITHMFTFDIGFVVFDAQGTPVAQVSVDEWASKLWSEPKQSKQRADILEPPRQERLKKLLEALGFRAVSHALAEQRTRQKELDGKAHAARYLPPSSGVATDLPLDRTTDAQRDRLCSWKELLFREGSPHSDESGGTGFICPDGVDVAAQLPSACRSEFPSCSATVGEVEACLRQMRFDGCFKQAGAEACAKLRPCFWGMDFTLTPPEP